MFGINGKHGLLVFLSKWIYVIVLVDVNFHFSRSIFSIHLICAMVSKDFAFRFAANVDVEPLQGYMSMSFTRLW